MNDIIKILWSMENSDLLVDVTTETVKKKTKKHTHKCWLLDAMMKVMVAFLIAPIASALIQLVAFSLISSATGKRKKQGNGFLPIILFILMLRV